MLIMHCLALIISGGNVVVLGGKKKTSVKTNLHWGLKKYSRIFFNEHHQTSCGEKIKSGDVIRLYEEQSVQVSTTARRSSL